MPLLRLGVAEWAVGILNTVYRCAECGKDLRALDRKPLLPPTPPQADSCIHLKEFIFFEILHTKVKR